MHVGFTDDQQQFREVVARFLSDKSPPTAVREWMASDVGYDPAVWQQLSQELGLVGIHIPEMYGGAGFGPVELGIVSQEMGRRLYCGPFFASAIMASHALLNADNDAVNARLLPGIAAGELKAALVLDDLTTADQVGHAIQFSQNTLTGEAKLVLDAHIADVMIVAASGERGVALYEIDPAAARVVPKEVVDPTRKLSTVTLNSVPAQLIGEAHIDQLWDQMSVMLAHEMVGGAEQLFETTIEYMKMRVQFGRAIGSFQALKHRCADLLLELELAKAMTHEAARFLAGISDDVTSPNMAKALASDAYMSIAKQAIQLRGGIGFTWEEDTHLWFKRAKASEVLLGTSNWHRERMIMRLEQGLGEVNHGG